MSANAMRQVESRDDVWARLAAPLNPNDIKQRQGAGGRMLDYIDAPVVIERLDSVVPGEWDSTLELLPPAGGEEPFAFKCRLQVLGVIREDVGTGANYKEAATDALKRAAVRFGIGLELYRDHGTPRPQVVRQEGENRRPPSTRGAAPTSGTAATKSTAVATADEPSCPKCGGRMWDNRASKRNPRAPDYKCRQRACDGVVWPEKTKPVGAPDPADDDYPSDYDDEELPF